MTQTTTKTEPDKRPIWERIAAISASVPAEVWATLPTDLAENHDRYLAARYATRTD